MAEENNSFDVTKNGHDLMNKASLVNNYFLENQDKEISIEKIKEQFPFLDSFDASKITALFKTFGKSPNITNIILGGLFLFIITHGKYPQDLWNDVWQEQTKTRRDQLKTKFNELNKELGELAPSDYESEFSAILKDLKRKDITPFIDDEIRTPGLVCLFELIYETFIAKYDKYSPRTYSKFFEQYRNKTFHKRKYLTLQLSKNNTFEAKPSDEAKILNTIIKPYAISFAGNQEKPGHGDCEDCSFVTSFECSRKRKIVLIAVCDGVGSAIDSETGSLCACAALEKTIDIYINPNKNSKVPKEETALKKGADSSGSTGNFAYLINKMQTNLAKDLYNNWKELVIKNSPYFKGKKPKSPSLEQFATTMQFAMITPLFVGIGKIGDGSLYVRKKGKNSGNYLDGIFEITDGRSDVLEKSVFNLSLLETNPGALHLSFFNTNEIKDILITSDGVSPLFKENIVRAYRIMEDLYETPYQNRITKLEKMAIDGSDVNVVCFGTGDDASVAYVSFGNEK